MFNSVVATVVDQVDALREQVDDHWQIPREEAQLLAQLVRAGRCRSICEVGMSYGFSTLHLAAATQVFGGTVHSFEKDPKKVEAAGKHLAQAGLDRVVRQHPGDARQTLGQVKPDKPYDFVFIDAVKSQSLAYLQALWPMLGDDVMLVTDNTVSHAEQLAGFVKHLRGLPDFASCQVAVGNGFELTIRRAS